MRENDISFPVYGKVIFMIGTISTYIELAIIISTIEEGYTRCPKKKWDLLLVMVAVNPTFFWDTLYLMLADQTCHSGVHF